MPRSGARTLADLEAGGRVSIACDKCGRAGRLGVAGLIETYGRDARLPDVLAGIAACERRENMSDPCAAVYVGLPG